MRSQALARIGNVFLAAALALAAPVAARAAQDDTSVAYRLLNTRVLVSGTVTSKVSFEKATREYEAGEVAVSLVAEPDAAWLQFDPASSVLSKESLTVQVAPNGALRSVNGVSEGQLGAIVRNVFSAVLGIVKTVGATPLSAGTNPAEDKYQQKCSTEQNRRKVLRGAIDTAVEEVARSAQQAAKESDAARLKVVSARIDTLLSVIKALQAQLEPLDARFAAWKAQFEDAKTDKLAYRLEVADLPADASISRLLGTEMSADQVAQALTGTAREIFQRLGTVITRVDAMADSTRSAAPASRSAVFYRLPRPVVFRLYTLGRVGDEKTRLILRKVSIENVIDEFSPIQTLALGTSKWTRKSVAATFTDAGALAQLSNERGSALAAATDVAKNLPADYLAVLKQANDVAGEQRKLALQAIDARIERINREKSEKEVSLALREVNDVGETKQQIAQLDAEARLLDSQRALQASGEAGDARRVLQAEQQVMALENAIAAARAERLELEAKLERLRREAGK